MKISDFIEAVHTWVDVQRPYVHSTLLRRFLGRATDLIPRPTLLLFDMWRRIFVASNSTEVLVRFTSLEYIVILSIIVIVRAVVESTNVVCPHNGTYDFCIFAIFSKTGFVDIVPLCCKPSLYCLSCACLSVATSFARWCTRGVFVQNVNFFSCCKMQQRQTFCSSP